MSKVRKIGWVAKVLFYVLIQIVIARYVVLFSTACCFVYVGLFLVLQQNKSNMLFILILSFIVGLVVDIFYDSLGMHSFASVLMVHLRPTLSKRILPPNVYELDNRIMLSNIGFKKFFTLAIMLILIHHTAFFLLDSWGNTLCYKFWFKAISTSILTCCAVFMIQAVSLAMHKK